MHAVAMLKKQLIILLLLLYIGCLGCDALDCRECAYLEVNTGNSLHDLQVRQYFQMSDSACQLNPGESSQRTCEWDHQHCVAITTEGVIQLHDYGIEAAVHVVYRNCSGLISPPAGCGTGEEWIYSIEEEITSLVEDRVPSLSTWEYETRDLEGTACYCEQDGCNDEEIITDENGQGGNSDNVDLTCYECATWRVETGNSMYDMAVESLIGGWSAIPCEDDPSVHVGRLCDGPHQHCVSTEIQLSVSIDVTGFNIEGAASISYRNCSLVQSPPVGCRHNDPDWISTVEEELLTLMEDRIDLSELDFQFGDITGDVCYCNRGDYCNRYMDRLPTTTIPTVNTGITTRPTSGDNEPLTCYECATWTVSTGNVLYDLAVQSEISGWNDPPCQNDPAFHVGRVCEGSHKYCISSYTTLNAMVEISGLKVEGFASILYRNCSRIQYPPVGCEQDEPEWIEAVNEELLKQAEDKMDLSDIVFEFGDISASVCYCNTSNCNDYYDRDSPTFPTTTNSTISTPRPAVTTTAPRITTTNNGLSCLSCDWAEGGKKSQNKLRKILPTKSDKRCRNEADTVKNGVQTCDEGDMCAALHLNISSYTNKGKKSKFSGGLWRRGCVPKSMTDGKTGCFTMKEFKHFSQGDKDLVTAMEEFLDTKVEGISGAVCLCDGTFCNSYTTDEMTTVAHSKPCIMRCKGMADGTYHQCNRCGQYFVCDRSARKGKKEVLKQCKRKHWDDKRQKCVKKNTSSTCSTGQNHL